MPDPDRRSSVLPVLLGLVGGACVGLALIDFGSGAVSVVLSMAVGLLLALLARNGRRIDALTRRLDALARRVEERAPLDTPVDVAPPAEAGLAVPDPALPDPAPMPSAPSPAASDPGRVRRTSLGADRPAAPPASRPALPPEIDAALRRAWAFASGGNPIVRVALVVLFVGFGIGIRYAAQLGLFPVEARLAAAGLAGLGLVGLGWSLREKSAAFALAVQGGGVALLYLTVYAAYALVGLLGAPVALALMATVALLGGALAVVQDAPGLAFLGALGGFAAPVVASTGSGNHVLLFSYYLALGIGIAALVWRRGWRSLAVLGVVGTFGIGGMWGGLEYRPELYTSTQPFLIAFFVLYFVLALRLAWLDLRSAEGDPAERDLAVDGTLLFGLPAATFVLQQGLVEGLPYGSAWSAGALAAVYLGVWALIRRRRAPMLLSDALLAVGIAFATLAMPLAFNRVVTGALWSLQAAALVWTGARQGKLWMRMAGTALSVGAAGVLLFEGVLDAGRAFTPETLTGWMVAVSLGLSAYVLDRASGVRPWERLAGRLLLAGGVLWWGLTAATHADTLAPDAFVRAAILGALGGSAAAFALGGRALAWDDLRQAALLAGPVAAGGALFETVRRMFETGSSPMDGAGWAGWPILLGACALALALGRAGAKRSHALSFALALWSAVGVAGLGLSALPASDAGAGWSVLGLGAPLAAALALLAWRGSAPALALVSTDRGRAAAGVGLALAAACAAFAFSVVPGGAAPLPTLPLLSPTDLTVTALLAALTAWLVRRQALTAPVAWSLGGLSLVAIAGVVARGAHHLTGVPFTPGALFDAAAFQAPLAVAWAVLALALTVTASRRGSRALWTAGVIVLALVVVKLFAVDLSRADALVRVGAFLAVGALMLWIGYRSPLPPRADEEAGRPANDPPSAPHDGVEVGSGADLTGGEAAPPGA